MKHLVTQLAAALLLLLVLASSSLASAKKQLLLTAEEPGGNVGFYSTDGDLLGKVKVGQLPHEIILTKDGSTAFVSNFGLHDYASPTGYAGYFISVINVHLMLEERKLFTFAAGAPAGSVQRAPHGIKLSPDEKQLWVNCEYTSPDGLTVTPQMLVFDLTDGSQEPKQSFTFDAQTNKNHNFVFSPDGKTIWLQNGAQGFAPMDPKTGVIGAATKPTVTGTVSVRGLVFAPDGNLVISGAGDFFIYDVKNASNPKQLKRYGGNWLVNQFLYASVTPNGKYLLAPSTNGQIFVINYATGALVKRVDVYALDPVMAVISSDSKTAYATGARGGAITKIDLTNLDFETELIETGVNAGPNGLVIADVPRGGVDTDRDEFRVAAVLSLSGTGQPNGYKIKSALEMWKEGINLAGGIPLYNGNAAEVVVRYFDDFSNASLTNNLLRDVLDDDWTPHALIVAETGFYPSAQLLRALAKDNVPLVSIYPLAAATKRDNVEELPHDELHRRQLPAPATVGHDRWVDNYQYNTEYITRFSRNATAIDGQATLAGLTLEAAAFQTGRISGSRFLSAIANTDTTFFCGGVAFSATGANTRSTSSPPSGPIYVNKLIPA